jgi:hypothetical protein
MAQTKRKRQTKHRGNAAGGIVARGRTGRPPSTDDKKRNDRDQRREDRLNRKPTVKGAAQKALLGAAFMFVFAFIFIHPKNGGGNRLITAVIEAAIAGLLYFFGMYYFESAMWRRRMKKKAATTRR